MKKATKAILKRAIWLGRGTATVMGLAVMLAVVLGVGTTALAAVPGNPFKLGQVNLINTISVLGGNTNNPMMRIINNSEGSNATALDIQVKPDRPPMKVNSSQEVQGLNVDQVDSLSASAFLQESTDRDDFFSGKTYKNFGSTPSSGGNSITFASAFCDPGDVVLSGGAFTLDRSEDTLVQSNPTSLPSEGWTVAYRNGGDGNQVEASVVCADFSPLR